MKATGTLGSPFLAVSKFWSCVTLSSIGTAPSQAAEANLMNTNERGEGLRERMQEERFRAIALLTRTVGRTAPCLLAELLTLLPLPPCLPPSASSITSVSEYNAAAKSAAAAFVL